LSGELTSGVFELTCTHCGSRVDLNVAMAALPYANAVEWAAHD
jgi:hypothetical protein